MKTSKNNILNIIKKIILTFNENPLKNKIRQVKNKKFLKKIQIK